MSDRRDKLLFFSEVHKSRKRSNVSKVEIYA